MLFVIFERTLPLEVVKASIGLRLSLLVMNAAVFHQAVCDGDATKVKFLINIGQQARVNQVNKQGLTALQQSCKDGNIDVVHVLLNHGANIALIGKKDRTALHFAAAGGSKDIVELLIN